MKCDTYLNKAHSGGTQPNIIYYRCGLCHRLFLLGKLIEKYIYVCKFCSPVVKGIAYEENNDSELLRKSPFYHSLTEHEKKELGNE